ncbi:hypothetical protein KY285_015384 [Solanum tuberosum]|nr:hypothetical protein KY285_015384 [Solanum tuberosum]
MYGSNAIFTAGYKAVLHIHAIVEECEIVELLQQIDLKKKKPMKKKPLFVKNGAIGLCSVQEYFSPLFSGEKFSIGSFYLSGPNA